MQAQRCMRSWVLRTTTTRDPLELFEPSPMELLEKVYKGTYMSSSAPATHGMLRRPETLKLPIETGA